MPNWNNIVREHLAVLRLPPEREIEIVEEQALHLEAAYEDALAAGLSKAEAEERALQSYDWRLLECELSRAELPVDARAWQPSLELIERKGGIRMGSFIQDLRFGARMLVKAPNFTLIAVVTLALGIGANITIFSVVNAVLLRPLPYPESERLVYLWSEAPRQNIRERASAYANFSEWRNQNKSFEDLAVFDPTVVTLTGAAEPEQVMSVRASANLFPLLGVAPLLGRTFTADEEQQKVRVVVLSHGLW